MPGRVLLVLSPITPAPSGNGLAMRTFMFASAAARDFDVRVAVVPVAGALPAAQAAMECTVVALPDAPRIRAGLPGLLADPAWRDWWSRMSPLPALARMAPPTLAADVVRGLAAAPDVVHVMRSYLAPLGVAVARASGARRITLDLDEDDVAGAVALGQGDEADAYGRLVSTLAREFDAIAMANPIEAATVSARLGRPVDIVPNAVDVPLHAPDRAPVPGRMLFVGNLTYWPNVEAAIALAERVLPAVRHSHPDAHVVLTGAFDGRLAHLADRPGVQLLGFVADLAPVYASAAAVVAPLRIGPGTRLKLLEAFASRVPVVTSQVGAAGIDVTSGEHALLADGDAATVGAVTRLFDDPVLGERLAAASGALVRARYSFDAVVPKVRGFLTR